MLKRIYRFEGGKKIKQIQIKGRPISGNFVLVKFLIYNNLTTSKFAIVISKKISKKAVTRNKIKRQISHIISKNISKIKSGLGVVIIVRKISSDFSSLENDLLNILTKGGILSKE